MKLSAFSIPPLALVLIAAAPTNVTAPPPIVVAVPPAPSLIPSIPVQPETPQLKGASVFVYSFLDVREKELGDKVLAQFHRQVMDALRGQGVNAQLMLFKDSLHSQFFLSQPKIPNGQRVVDQVPVLETVAANSARETAANARYRLLILPADFEMAGAWRYYTVRWIVMDTKTNQLVWKRDYRGKHLTMWRTNENAEGRGRKLTDAGIAMMREDKLL